ncbi:MAG: PAS domain S-box protein [Sedimentisphaerales bacterium]|nr:PAS domain S-box protein [Sedimentisphaerales bacterium]
MATKIVQDNKIRVLLIEDDRIDQLAFRRAVENEQHPYDYKIAGSVSQARDILADECFDIIISDHSLGDGTAFDVWDSTEGTPIIFATGAGNEALATRAMKAGAYDYLIKDQDRNYLKILPEIIKNAIGRKKAQDELDKYHKNLEIIVKERTEQLAAEKELLAVTLSSMADALIAADVDKKIILFNKVAESMTGFQFEQIKGKSINEVFRFIDEQTKEPIENPADKVLNSGKIKAGSGHEAIVTRNGSEHSVAATATPIRNIGGAMIGIVMVLRDVSNEREIDRMKSDFVSSVSHELRTPLTSIRAYASTILRDPNMAEQTRRQFVTVIDKESERLGRLIEDVLEISRIESGLINISKQLLDVSSIIEQVVSTLRPLAEKKNVQMKLELDSAGVELVGDESKIRSAISNLVDNAIKFTKPGGRVSVSLRQLSEELVIAISDTGMGIPKDALQRIFRRFFRVHHEGKQIPGTGLGLAIVKEVITLHSGRIEVQSKLEEGTTFRIFLPIQKTQLQIVAGN